MYDNEIRNINGQQNEQIITFEKDKITYASIKL